MTTGGTAQRGLVDGRRLVRLDREASDGRHAPAAWSQRSSLPRSSGAITSRSSNASRASSGVDSVTDNRSRRAAFQADVVLVGLAFPADALAQEIGRLLRQPYCAVRCPLTEGLKER